MSKNNDLFLRLTMYGLIDYNADIFLILLCLVNIRKRSIPLILALLCLSFARSRW